MEYDPKTATEEEKEEWWRKRYGDAKYPEPTWNTVGFDTNATLENVFDLPKKEEDYFIEKEHTVEQELHQEHYDEDKIDKELNKLSKKSVWLDIFSCSIHYKNLL